MQINKKSEGNITSESDYLNESLKKIAVGTGFGFIGIVIGRIFGFCTRIFLARFLSEDSYGLLNLGLAGYSISTVFASLGTGRGIIRYVSYFKGRDEKSKIKGIIISAVKINLSVALLISVIVYLGSDWLSIHAFHNPALSPILKIFSISIPFTILAGIFISTTIGFQDSRYSIYVHDISENAIRLVTVAILLSLGFGVLGAVWGWVVAVMFTPFLAFFFLEKRVFPLLRLKLKAESMEKELLSFSLPLLFVGFSGLILEWTDTLMLGYFTTSWDVGIYNAALPTARILQTIPSVFAVIFMPVISELYRIGKFEEIKRIYTAVTKWILTLTMPIFLLFILFPLPVMRIIFGMGYVEGSSALVILSFGYVSSSLFGLTSPMLEAYGLTKMIMYSIFFGAIINIILNWYLIPMQGINGAAIATSSSFAIISILQFFFVYKAAGTQPLCLNHLKIVFLAILAIFVVYLIANYILIPSFFILIVMFFIYLSFYLLLLLLFKGFEEEDLIIMRMIDQKLGTKTDLPRMIIKKFL
jgi:O-antigen/teichoic acid export membrane protein